MFLKWKKIKMKQRFSYHSLTIYTKEITMKFIRSFSLLISLVILLLMGSMATGIIQAQEPDPSIRTEIEAALARAIAQRPAWLLPGSNDFIIDHLGVDGDQAYIIANRWPVVVPQDAEVVSPDILLAV